MLKTRRIILLTILLQEQDY